MVATLLYFGGRLLPDADKAEMVPPGLGSGELRVYTGGGASQRGTADFSAAAFGRRKEGFVELEPIFEIGALTLWKPRRD